MDGWVSPGRGSFSGVDSARNGGGLDGRSRWT